MSKVNNNNNVFIAKFEHISHLVFIVNFEQVNVGWGRGVSRSLSSIYDETFFAKIFNG